MAGVFHCQAMNVSAKTLDYSGYVCAQGRRGGTIKTLNISIISIK